MLSAHPLDAQTELQEATMSQSVQTETWTPGRHRVPERPTLPERLCNVGRLIETLEQRGLDGVIATLTPNVYYLSSFYSPTGHSAEESNGYSAVIFSRHDPEHPILVVADVDVTTPTLRPIWVKDVRPYASLLLAMDAPLNEASLAHFVPRTLLESPYGRHAIANYANTRSGAIVQAARELGLLKGVIGLDDVRLAPMLEQAAGDDFTGEFRDAYGAIKHVRQVKTPEELELLRFATSLNERALRRTIASWYPGMTWQELIHTYHLEAVGLGGFVPDPSPQVMSNPRGSEPVWYPLMGSDDYVLEEGTNIMFDCHGTVLKYCWDGGKTWTVGGEPGKAARSGANALGAAMEEIHNTVRPGDMISTLQERGMRALERSGLTDARDIAVIYFHGLGLEHIDQEESGERSDWPVVEGMVLSSHIVYPGALDRRMFLEDIALVTPAGGDTLFSWDRRELLHG
jgi:Xaa-Pro dipeptidase